MDMKYSSEMMGQQIEQTVVTSTKSEMVIINATDTEIKIEDKTKKLKMNSEAMGQQMEFDSDNPNENGLLKNLNDIINKTTIITADGNGIIKTVKYDETVEKLQAQSPISGNGYEIGHLLSFILLLPKEISIGTTWNQKVGNTELKEDYTYTVKSIENGTANIDFTAIIIQDKKSEMQGNKVESKLSGTMSGKLYVDVKTNFVFSRIRTSNLKGIIEVMGQSAPVEMTMVTEEFYQ